MVEPIPEQELEEAFKDSVRSVCASLAEVCYRRIMADPEEGFRYLNHLARQLDCQLVATFKFDTAEQQEGNEP